MNLPFKIILGIYERHGQGSRYQFLPVHQARVIEHQCGGVSCLHRTIHGLELTPRPELITPITQLCDRYWGSEEWGSPTLHAAIAYRDALRQLLNADCNLCYHDLCEAWYPVDTGFANALCTNQLPQDLDELLDWTRSPNRILGMINRWSLVILSENSD